MSVQTSQRNRPFRWRPDQQWEAYLFLLPSLAGFSVFVVLAVIASLGISFSDWGLTGFKDFAGWSNYRALFRDPIFWKSLGNTGFYLVTIVPMQLGFGLLLALALNQAVRGQMIYRLIYFMPVVTTIVAGAIVFRLILSTNGPLNGGIMGVADLLGLSLDPPNWLGSSRYTKWSVVMLALWKNTGFTMVIYLAALQGVPQELYDAAMADGASSWQRLRHVTLPLISPTTFFLFVYQAIGAFQLFTEPFVMTQGGPANASLSVVQYIYYAAFRDIRMDKASAMAWVLFLFIFAFTWVQNRMQQRWVYYETE
ncbi:MAG: sugar ABC transporter permease [Caldilineaceae bacterium]|nr:sugar ABC transporter permease [Caldilineaceae bacterium]MBP8109445.1 sugar ABC transporter permease [Caldilineaceae bacterium]MBP8124700.1 sugar ABC transporter permease [Caldilineaceae bacterium]MBP9071684.1 sugar ABC transporter permease [Caldilineaceae bacterium]